MAGHVVCDECISTTVLLLSCSSLAHFRPPCHVAVETPFVDWAQCERIGRAVERLQTLPYNIRPQCARVLHIKPFYAPVDVQRTQRK